jgi:hypothetical protein
MQLKSTASGRSTLTSNQGWWLGGAMDDRGGPDRKPNIRHDDAMILQSTFPFDTDLTGEGLDDSVHPRRGQQAADPQVADEPAAG